MQSVPIRFDLTIVQDLPLGHYGWHHTLPEFLLMDSNSLTKRHWLLFFLSPQMLRSVVCPNQIFSLVVEYSSFSIFHFPTLVGVYLLN